MIGIFCAICTVTGYRFLISRPIIFFSAENLVDKMNANTFCWFFKFKKLLKKGEG